MADSGSRTRDRRGRSPVRAAALVALALCAGCATQRGGDDPQLAALLAAGQNLELAGAHDEALVQYVKALQLDEHAAEAHYRIGRVHAALGSVPTSRQAFERALVEAPGHAGALEGLGLLDLEAGQREAAAARLHKALAREPGRWRSYNGLGVLADLQGKHDLAQAYFRQGLKARPADLTLLNNLGYSLYLDGQVAEAQREFERVVAADPKNGKGWSNLSLVLTRQGRYPAAVQALERIMTPAEARYSVGYVCLIDGRLTDAERLLKESIRRSDSYNPAAHQALKRVRDEQDRRARVGDEED